MLGYGLIWLCYGRFGWIRFGYISFLYFIIQKFRTCCIYKYARAGIAAVPVSCAYKCLQIWQPYLVVIPYLYGCRDCKHCQNITLNSL